MNDAALFFVAGWLARSFLAGAMRRPSDTTATDVAGNMVVAALFAAALLGAFVVRGGG